MAQFKHKFIAQEHLQNETEGERKRLPPGEHKLTITKVIDGDPNSQQYFLTIIMEPDNPEYLPVFRRVYFKHPSKITVDISKQHLARIVLACGLTALEDTDELINKSLLVTLEQNKQNPEYTNPVKYRKVVKTETKQQQDRTENDIPF